MPLIKLKWNKSTFDDVSVDETVASVEDFKRVVNQLTGVPLHRQKLMAKGVWNGTLKDDADFSTFEWKEGQVVTLMGSADIVSQTETVTFIEDMTDAEQAAKGVLKVSAGLANLGNTCYMNATIQCLRHMDELKSTLDTVNTASFSDIQTSQIVTSFKETISQLNASGSAIIPSRFVFQFRQIFPQFAQRTNQGHFMQQDADEFYNVLTQALIRNIDSQNNQMETLLGIEVEEELTCAESPDEPPVKRNEKLSKIVCSIQGGLGSTVTVDHMHEGIKLWLEGTVEKHSAILNRNALWKRKARLSKLPKYLCIQYLRFFWKPTPESTDHAGVKCKILRPVSFPETLDVYQFCAEPIQNELRINRETEDKAIEDAVKASAAAAAAVDDTQSANAMEVDEDEARALQEAMAISLGRDPSAPNILEHLPRNFTGMYELHSLVTHKGRSTDSGHYIGWTRQSPGSDAWWKYDDDKVTEVTTADIMQLKGGGDRDMIYLVFYRAKSNADMI